MNYYHPETMEHIRNPLPAVADWAGETALTPPAYDPATESCRFVAGAWVVALNPVGPPAPTQQELAALKVKEIRAKALEHFTKNSGVAQVYSVNYEAAILGATDNTTILRTGKTPQEHLAAKGARIINALYPTGMTAAQFADYIIKENRGTDPYTAGAVKMDEIEDEYLRVLYVLLPAAVDDTERAAVIAAYQTFCDARTA